MRWCSSFIAVYELGGFSAAARALHRSQSRLSAHVAALEAHLGETLLHRDVHPPTLTGAGEAFLPHARGVNDEWSAAVAAVESRRGDISGTVAIGSIPSVSSQILAPVLADFGQRHPRVTFEVHEGPSSWLDEALGHRTVEIALRPVVVQQRPQTEIERRVLLVDPFVVILKRSPTGAGPIGLARRARGLLDHHYGRGWPRRERGHRVQASTGRRGDRPDAQHGRHAAGDGLLVRRSGPRAGAHRDLAGSDDVQPGTRIPSPRSPGSVARDHRPLGGDSPAVSRWKHLSPRAHRFHAGSRRIEGSPARSGTLFSAASDGGAEPQGIAGRGR